MTNEEALAQSMRRRLELAEELRCDIDKRAAAMALCALDIPFWFNNFVWTFDPRLVAGGGEPWIPFDLFPRQIDLVHWLDERIERREDGILGKSRDVGVTWLIGGYYVNRWLFRDNFKGGLGSRVEDLVDKIGSSDSIFGKVRLIMDRLPPWMMPQKFNPLRHDKTMLLINPDNGSVIIGEGGNNIGRGGRNLIYTIDEAAFLEHPELAESALSANADTKIWASSVNPKLPNLFWTKYTSGNFKTFRYHYSDDPRKDADWVAMKKKSLKSSPGAWEAEYEINPLALIENVCIPAMWVQSAHRLYRMIASGEIPYKRPKEGSGGLDVGAGKAKSVLVPLFGIMVEQPAVWQQVDNIQTTYAALDEGLAQNLNRIVYDATGVGNTVTSTLNHVPQKYAGITTQPLNAGAPPEDVKMPDDRDAKEWFRDIKIQLWWRARERFQATHEFMQYIDGDPEGVPHELFELIALCDCAELSAELSMPLWFKNDKGLMILESKKQLAKRGVKSPDYADALILTLAEPDYTLLFTSV